MTQHIHFAQASTSSGDTAFAANNVLAAALNVYAPAANLVALNAGSLTNTGGSQAHNNMQPFLVLTFCIALQGIFPSQT
jgi:microcystin-dependent protein